MFRLAALLGVACLALAACSLAAASRPLSENPSRDANSDKKQLPEQGPRFGALAQFYHAQFSLN